MYDILFFIYFEIRKAGVLCYIKQQYLNSTNVLWIKFVVFRFYTSQRKLGPFFNTIRYIHDPMFFPVPKVENVRFIHEIEILRNLKKVNFFIIFKYNVFSSAFCYKYG